MAAATRYACTRRSPTTSPDSWPIAASRSSSGCAVTRTSRCLPRSSGTGGRASSPPVTSRSRPMPPTATPAPRDGPASSCCTSAPDHERDDRRRHGILRLDPDARDRRRRALVLRRTRPAPGVQPAPRRRPGLGLRAVRQARLARPPRRPGAARSSRVPGTWPWPDGPDRSSSRSRWTSSPSHSRPTIVPPSPVAPPDAQRRDGRGPSPHELARRLAAAAPRRRGHASRGREVRALAELHRRARRSHARWAPASCRRTTRSCSAWSASGARRRPTAWRRRRTSSSRSAPASPRPTAAAGSRASRSRSRRRGSSTSTSTRTSRAATTPRRSRPRPTPRWRSGAIRDAYGEPTPERGYDWAALRDEREAFLAPSRANADVGRVARSCPSASSPTFDVRRRTPSW